jgi:hypothetical protein
MPNATTERTPVSIIYGATEFNSYDTMIAEINSLRAAVTSGGTIYANDLNRISTLINNMNGHVHNYTDTYQEATYGNNGDRTLYTESKNTSGPDSVITSPTNTFANQSITASRHNELRNAINAIAYHNHGIDDRTG